jgi:flavodoxin/NAD-dependent dihydropyrimidine dehydrogenase PreA subunit
MKKILIAYFSGSGSTKNISEVLKTKLSSSFEVELIEIATSFDYSIFEKYDIVVFGFPTFGCEPPKTVLEFVEDMPTFSQPLKGFVFTTYALYQENCLRHFIKKISEKNFIITDYCGIRGPASDGALVFPESWSFIYNYERFIKDKLNFCVKRISELIDVEVECSRVPAIKWYTLINRLFLHYLEKEYDTYIKSIKLLEERCINCKTCIKNCQRNSWTEGEKYPVFKAQNCEFCLKCIHNCPQNAIIFSEKMKDRRRLNKQFYKKKQAELLKNK